MKLTMTFPFFNKKKKIYMFPFNTIDIYSLSIYVSISSKGNAFEERNSISFFDTSLKMMMKKKKYLTSPFCHIHEVQNFY